MEYQTANQLLPDFYKQYNLPADGGQKDDHVKVEINNQLHFYIPNFEARRRAVLKHDVHHLVTGYPSNLRGEAEISAWEIASGCTNYWAALLLDSQGLLLGAFFYPARTFRAFKRGRRSTNLYKDQFNETEFLNMKISALKRHLKLNNSEVQYPTELMDVFSYIAWIFICSLIGLSSILLLPFFIFYNIKLFLRQQ